MQITGTIVERRTGVLVDGVRVQAWDPAVVPTEGEPLAEETTSSGAFGMTLGADGDAEELDVVFRVLVEKTLVGVEATHLVSLRLRRAKATLRVDDPFGTLWRVFVRARDASGEPLVGYEAHAVDVAGRHAGQTTPVGAGGRFALTYPNEPPDLRLWLVGGAETLVPESRGRADRDLPRDRPDFHPRGRARDRRARRRARGRPGRVRRRCRGARSFGPLDEPRRDVGGD